MFSAISKGRKKGFSLLEVLVAFDILAVALFFIIGLVPFDNASVKQDAHIMVATQLGQELLQNIAGMFYVDGSVEDGVPLSSQWDGFLQTGNVYGVGGISPALYCLSSTCPSGVTVDTNDKTRPADTLFPPYPYAPPCNGCPSISNYGSVTISTTSDGIPDSRQYYLDVETEGMEDDGTILFSSPTVPPADEDLRYVQVVVYWHEQTTGGAVAPGPNQPGYRQVTLTANLTRKAGP